TTTPVDAEPIYQELLGANLDAAARAWVLIVKGEARRAQGDRDEARTQFELAQTVASGTPMGRQAAVRQARIDFEIREYNQAVTDLTPLLNAKPGPGPQLLLPALLLQAEDLAAGREMVERIIASYPTHPRADFARFNRGLALLRQGDAAGADAALRDWLGRAPFPALFGRAHAALGTALLAQGKRDEA